MRTTDIPISQLTSEDCLKLKTLIDMKLHDLRGALYTCLPHTHERWTLDRIKERSDYWTRGEMVSCIFQHYLSMKPNATRRISKTKTNVPK